MLWATASTIGRWEDGPDGAGAARPPGKDPIRRAPAPSNGVDVTTLPGFGEGDGDDDERQEARATMPPELQSELGRLAATSISPSSEHRPSRLMPWSAPQPARVTL
jgi:hypothetical protein